MSFAVVVDMNLTPDWVPLLQQYGHTAAHWSAVGDPTALDSEIVDWARANGPIILTHDLDFGTILAQTHAVGPSVLLVRGQETFPTQIGAAVVAALHDCSSDL